MENLILLFATTLMASIRSNRFRRYKVGDTGCSVSMLNHDGFHVSRTSGGDHMYFAESKNNGAEYGLVMIQFSEAGKPARQWKTLLCEFSKSLYPSFGIVHATAPEWNYWHPQSPAAIGF